MAGLDFGFELELTLRSRFDSSQISNTSPQYDAITTHDPRPHVEAMAMGLPLIATDWSGPTEFMTPVRKGCIGMHMPPPRGGSF